MRGCAFFETDDSYTGVSRADVRSGDRSFVLLGGEPPSILRPFEKNPSLNQVCGPCYPYGLMFAEILLRTIPESWGM